MFRVWYLGDRRSQVSQFSQKFKSSKLRKSGKKLEKKLIQIVYNKIFVQNSLCLHFVNESCVQRLCDFDWRTFTRRSFKFDKN